MFHSIISVRDCVNASGTDGFSLTVDGGGTNLIKAAHDRTRGPEQGHMWSVDRPSDVILTNISGIKVWQDLISPLLRKV